MMKSNKDRSTQFAPRASLFGNVKSLPRSPGVYIMKDASGLIIYVGKALNLRTRVKQYFSGHDTRPQIKFLMLRVVDIETLVTQTEAEALLLENALIKKHRPKYNLFLKDDKTFQLLRLSAKHDFQALTITRKIKDDGALYYGPFISSAGLHEVIEFIESHFKIRTCSDAEFARRTRPCVEYQIHRCTAPCMGKISKEEYALNIASVRLFLEGRKKELQREIRFRMWKAAQDENYEEAARWRDLMHHTIALLETQKYARHDLHVAGVSVMEHQRVGARHAVPLRELKHALHLTNEPHRIECYDISNISGTHAVGSMVVFVDGKNERSAYRRFKIRSVDGNDDYAMMREVLGRRFKRPSPNGGEGVPSVSRGTGEGGHRWILPDLIVVDGGRGQLSIALRLLRDMGMMGVGVIALAKEHEEIYIPGRKNPIILKPRTKELQLLQRIRDEAHRFAITYHRSLREKELTKSVLDRIEGIGPVLKRRLIQHFGSAEAIFRALEEDLVKVRGVNRKLVEKIGKSR